MTDVNEFIANALDILNKKPIDGYEIYLHQTSHFSIESKDSKVDTFETSHSGGVALRILNHQRIGFSYTTFFDLSPSARKGFLHRLERIIEDAIRSAEAISPDPCFDFAPDIKNLPPHPPIFDATLKGILEKTKIEKAIYLEEATRSVDPRRIKKVRKASYEEVISQRTLVNSNGLRITYPSTLASLSVAAVAEDSGESEVGWDFDTSHFFNDLDVEKVGMSAGRKALDRLGGKRISSGVYPILVRNGVASEFLSLLAHSFIAEQIQKGKSPLKGKRGEKLFSPLVSILDDGLHAKGITTSPIDGEGMASQRTVLVDRGEIVGYLYDRYWANRENATCLGSRNGSTGNSRRYSLKSPPGIGISNFLIQPGDAGFPALMEDLHRGIVVDDVMGIHTVDPISGDFSLGCSGDWIEKGKKVHPVKSIAIAGNLFELFKNVIGVGEDFRFFGGVGAPSLLVSGLKISGH